jgi:hypothetical protein
MRPDRFRAVDMAVPESCHKGSPLTIEDTGVRGNGDLSLRANRHDLAIANQQDAAGNRRLRGRGEDRSTNQRERLPRRRFGCESRGREPDRTPGPATEKEQHSGSAGTAFVV